MPPHGFDFGSAAAYTREIASNGMQAAVGAERSGGRGKGVRARWDRLFRLTPEASGSLQSQIRQMIVAAIAERHLMPGDPVPSSRELSEILGVARNTVVLAYQQLIDEGLLISEERSGCFVNPQHRLRLSFSGCEIAKVHIRGGQRKSNARLVR